MNKPEMIHDAGVFTRNSDTPSGSTTPTTSGGIRRTRCAPSIIAGSEATDERVLSATICAGNVARANWPSDTPPPTRAATYSSAPMKRSTAQCAMRKNATAPARFVPRCNASPIANTNTPIGASANTHLTRMSAAVGIRTAGARRDSATPKTTANTIIGSIAPSAAALIGFAGTSATSQLAKPGSVGCALDETALARSDAAEAGSM